MSVRPVTSKAVVASRKRDLCADDIANLIQPVALELLGTPNHRLSSLNELRFGSNGSLSVGIAGDRIGQWYSFEDGTGGGVLDLIVRQMGGHRACAMTWLKSRPYCPVGTDDGQRRIPPRQRRMPSARAASPSHTPEEELPNPELCHSSPDSALDAAATDALDPAPAPDSPQTFFIPPWRELRDVLDGGPQPTRREEALAVWRAGLPVAGTPAEVYLRSRGLDPDKLASHDRPGEWPETLRYSIEYPGIALIVAVNDARTGLVVAIQRIFLTREGSPVYKADVYRDVPPEKNKKIKLSLGPIDGNAARFSCWPDPQGRWGIAEGPETALAAQQLFGFPVWSAIHAGNMAKIDPPHWASEAFVFADHDDAGLEAGAATATRLSEMPSIHRVQIVRAAARGADMADVLKEPAR